MKFVYTFIFSIFFAFSAWADVDDTTGRDDTQIYHVYDGIDLVSTLKIQYDKPRIVVKSVYPQLESDGLDDELNIFNQMVSDFVTQQISDFKLRVDSNKSAQANLDDSKRKNNLYIDYASSAIKTNIDHLISIRFTIQGAIAGTAHPYHYHRVLNYNLDTRQQLSLDDLFKPESNYLEVLSQYIGNKLARRFTDTKMITVGTAPIPENFQNWNIKPLGLVFTFDENQVAPYVYGAQTVFVPYSAIKKIIAKDSPITYCVTHKWKCKQHNLLTGGFIEEAQNKVKQPILSQR